ncbi:biotin--[acetyl-CoA-carboxylase] ligase [Uliginosibacterium sp. H3]|uniref:biotin--[biotin carboxyl-carrier protein] ligase n=1 Tax=Uliginosibacterium silvisoli TaxID=3114758 RepID=A0ABU6JXM2_9RHOO|nr:biotin--[acetyl-CoA-carboxylase] ligase [Uliginosibacterium sp. H3]
MPQKASSFDLRRVRDLLGPQSGRFDVDHVTSCDSTNTQLLTRAERGSGAGTVLVADQQTAGRGRRGRQWQSAPGSSLTFSLLWRFPREQRLEGLSLSVGIAIVHALSDMGIRELSLKWPNDIWLMGRKLGGVLVEVVHGTHGDMATVIGMGLNLQRNPDWDENLGASYAALVELKEGLTREAVLAAILRELLAVLDVFAREGFAALADEWMRYHAMFGSEVSIEQSGLVRHGRCGGIDALGRLEVETAEGKLRVFGGEVSLRRRA